MKLVIGNDHAAVDLKFAVMGYLVEKGYEVVNVGIDQTERCNYPDIAVDAVSKIQQGEADLGILICGTGAGMSVAANKQKGIRAVVCSEPVTARLAREHNHANVICFGARIVGTEMAFSIVDAFLGAEELGGRHQERVDLIAKLEEQ